MSKPERSDEDDLVPLWQAGIPRADIEAQLDKLCHSYALEGKGAEKNLLKNLVRESLAGNVGRLHVSEITTALFRHSVPGDSRVRGDAGKLRGYLDTYYASAEAKLGEIRFAIPERQYVVYTLKASGKSAETHTLQAAAAARILEPARGAEVHQRIPVRGTIDALDLNLRPWLVVRTPVGDHYPQCRVRRKGPEWEEEVRIGRLQWGSDEDAIYEILFVAADADGDLEFYQYLKANRDGFGPILPTDCLVLDTCPVTRRDIRPKG